MSSTVISVAMLILYRYQKFSLEKENKPTKVSWLQEKSSTLEFDLKNSSHFDAFEK